MSSTKTHETKQHVKAIQGPPTLSKAVEELWARCSNTGLSREELKFFAGCTEAAGNAVRNLRDTLEGLAILVYQDKTRAWAFQCPRNLPPLLFSISESLDAIAALSCLGEYAFDELLCEIDA